MDILKDIENQAKIQKELSKISHHGIDDPIARLKRVLTKNKENLTEDTVETILSNIDKIDFNNPKPVISIRNKEDYDTICIKMFFLSGFIKRE